MSREKEPNVLESSFFFPNKFVANHIYKKVENLYENTEEMYHIFIGTAVFIVTFFIMRKALHYAKGTSKAAYRLGILLPLIIIWCLINYYNPFNFTNAYPRYSLLYNMFYIFSVGALFSFKNNFYPKSDSISIVNNPESLFNKLAISFALLMFLFIILLLIIWGFTNTNMLQTFFEHVLVIFMFVAAIGIGFILLKKRVNKDKINQKEPWLIEKIIFYLPCLLIDLIDYIKEQNRITTPTVWILLALELAFVGLYYLLPIIFFPERIF